MEKFSIEIKVAGPDSRRKLLDTIDEFEEFEVMVSANAFSRPDILVLELGEDPETVLDVLEENIDAGKAGEVFVLSDHKDPDILMRAMRIGIKEYLTVPLDPADFARALMRFREKNVRRKSGFASGKSGKIIGVVGSKGGVGTTTIAVNLAVALRDAARRKSVALVDLNVAFGEIPLFLDISARFNWGEALKNIDRMDDAYLSNILTPYRPGLSVLASPEHLNGQRSTDPENLGKLLAHVKNMFDHVVIDCGHGRDKAVLKAMQMSDVLLPVSILTLPSLKNTQRLIEMLSYSVHSLDDRIKWVVNKHSRKEEIDLKDAEEGIGRKIFWTVPNDRKTAAEAINQGKPIKAIASRSRIAKNFAKMADKLLVRPGLAPKKKLWIFGGKS